MCNPTQPIEEAIEIPAEEGSPDLQPDAPSEHNKQPPGLAQAEWHKMDSTSKSAFVIVPLSLKLNLISQFLSWKSANL